MTGSAHNELASRERTTSGNPKPSG